MNRNTNDKESIVYEQFVAGALLKFEFIDSVDFSLLVEDFETKTNIDMDGCFDVWRIGRYANSKKGIILLRDGISLDYFIKEENRTLREKLQEVAGNKVNNYFSSLEIEIFKQKKEKALLENKDKVLNTANVLLISDVQDDYDELMKYGFQNVDYFKSIIRADQYFAKHPEELEKYHLVLKGNQNVQHCCFEGDVELDRTIDRLRDKNQILNPPLRRYDYPDHIELVTYLSDRNNHRGWNPEELTYQDIFDRIVENMLINHTLEKVDLKDKKFVPIEDYINPNRLPLPTKKSDLKILYLDPIKVSDFATRISEELKLDITFKEDNNCSLGRYIKTHLGDYDIIIVSRLYSSNLLGMNVESTEQCKDTGRELTLLVTQEELCCGVDSDLGDGIKLGYVFGGNYAPDSEYHSKEIRILRQSIEVEEESEYWKKYSQGEYSQIRWIIEASVNFYNQALIQMNKPTIGDLDLKTAEALEQEYVNAFENKRAKEQAKKAKEQAELAPIREFDDIRYVVMKYLENRKKKLINQVPKGLRIIEGKDGIKVENVHDGRILCAIIFSKNNNEQKNIRVFEIQTVSKKGILLAPQTIGVYTSQYESLESTPPRPDERQASAITSIQKKVNCVLGPLNEEVRKKTLELEKQKVKTYSC